MSSIFLSFQYNIKQTHNLHLRRLEDLYELIKTGGNRFDDLPNKTLQIRNEQDHNKQNELKAKLLPYACFNGRFSTKSEDGLLFYSPYTAIDFDQFKTEEELLGIAYWLTQTPCVKMLFRSPSGQGLKAIVEHTNTNPKKHRALYNELLRMFKIPEIDTKTSDLSRATFLCYDPAVWWNECCAPFEFDENLYEEDSYTFVDSGTKGHTQKDTDSLDKMACEALGVTDGSIKRIIGKWIANDFIAEGERNSKLFEYGCKFCKAGVKYSYALQLLEEVFVGLGLSFEEINRTCFNAYQKCKDEFGSKRWYYTKNKKR